MTTATSVTYHDSSNGTEKDGVRGKIGRKTIARLQQVPWQHADPDNSGNKPATADVLGYPGE